MVQIEITVVENGIIVKHGETRWVYKDMADLFSHNQPELGDHFLLTIEKLPPQKEQNGLLCESMA